MPQAKKTNTILSPNFSTAIERMKQIAAQSSDHLLLSDGPVHPDAALLDLCAEIGHARHVVEAALERWRATPWRHEWKTEADSVDYRDADRANATAGRTHVTMLRAVSKDQSQDSRWHLRQSYRCPVLQDGRRCSRHVDG